MKKKLLIFHLSIAPYRIDYFNELYKNFDTKICLQYWNVKSQKFDYQKIYDQFEFVPQYLPEGSKWEMLKNVWRQLKQFTPDIVMTCEFNIITLFVLISKLFSIKKYKVVIMTDDSYDMVSNNNNFTFRHKIARGICAPLADNLITIEPRVKEWYFNKYGKGLFFPIIVDDVKAEANYERLLPISRKYVEQYGLTGKKVFLFVGRLVELKNLCRVLEAFGQTNSDAVFVIIGNGPEREVLEEQAKKINKEILFAGRFEGDELYAWYNLANILILASYKEAFGAVTNEALLAGCRVIISNKAGSSCLVCKSNGEVVDPLDVQGIASAIDRQLKLSSIPNLKKTRQNLMNYSFNERMQELIESF
ncbi:MAG: glycosyltransferase family 4 protein [Salinivirgaceae bacterium]|nr:glycosyltransferase family 4 protein [Salinivirgaceae bacterium]